MLLPIAVRVLEHDPDPHVRAIAVEVVGKWVHTDARAETALLRARTCDAAPAVRKKAGWYAPGGPIHCRTQPKERRT